MSNRLTTFLITLLALCAAGWGGARGAQTPAQEGAPARTRDAQAQPGDEEETRQIKYSEFTKKRPAPSSPPRSSGSGGNSPSWNAPTYRRVRRESAPVRRRTGRPRPADTTAARPDDRRPPTGATRAQPAGVKDVGVTLWRLRPANEADSGPGFQVLQGGKMIVMVPERVEGTSPVSLGDRVRISVESPRDGYLYIINREQYADGTTGAPALIFPVTRIRGGDNKVAAGRLIDIPDAADAQPYFTLTTQQKPGQPQNVGELITIIISPRPLEGFTPGPRPIPLAASQVAKWEEDWEGDVAEVLEMNGGAGKTWTQEEKLSGEATRALTQLDPTPQTIYRVSGRPNDPLMLTVQMIYGPQAAPQTGAASPQP